MNKALSLSAALLLAGALSIATGCEDIPGTPGAPGDAPGAARADGAPLELLKLSSQENAKVADVAVGADGTLHALFLEQNKRHYRNQVYYRASRDGGATWSETLNLLEDDLESLPGMLRLAIDGEGRVYAFWKNFRSGALVRPDGGEEGNLVFRVLTNGQWSAATPVGTAMRVVSWFPAVAPDGRMHIVWNEVFDRENGDHSPYWQAGWVRQAELTGAAVGEARDVFKSEPMPVPPNGAVVNYDGFTGLNGYVDAQGRAHFAAVKIASEAKVGASSAMSDVVHWDGAKMHNLLKVARLEAVLKPIPSVLPTLLRDAEGREHLVLVNQSLDRPAVLDYSPITTEAPTTVFQLATEKGDIRSFQAYQGPSGKMAALVSATDDASVKHDLRAVTFDGARWQAPINVTSNKAREEFMSKQTSLNTNASQLIQYSAQSGAGAFDAAGRLNLLLVNSEIVSIMQKTDTAYGGSGFFGSNSTTNVYFTKL